MSNILQILFPRGILYTEKCAVVTKGGGCGVKKLIAILLILCILSGCAQENASPVEPSVLATETAAVASEAPEVTVPESVELAAVNVHSFRKTKEKPSVALLDHRTAAFLTGEYPENDFSRKCTRIQIVDLHSDILIREQLLEGTCELLRFCAATGHLAVTAEAGDVLVLDRNLREVLRFHPEDMTGILTADLQEYYYVWGRELRCFEIGSGEIRSMDDGRDLGYHEILDYDPRENILLVSAYVGTYATEQCIAGIDLDTMEQILLYRGVSTGRLAEKGVLLEQENTLEQTADLYYADWTDSTFVCLPEFLVNDPDYAAWHIPGSDYVCRFTYDANQKVDIVEFELFRLGERITAASLQEQLDGAKITRIFALADGNLLAMEAGSRGYRTYLICPEQLEFSEVTPERLEAEALVDLSVQDPDPEQAPWQLPESLIPVRQRADALEQKYDITILLSGQCTEALEGARMNVTTTDRAFLRDEAGAIEAALEDLDEMFALYPQDFFQQFRDEAGQRGLLVLLVENFEDEMNVIGLSYWMGDWYPVVVDITSGEVANTYCHEIWHATETRIQDLDPVALDLAAWDACNPEGYLYSGNMTPSYIQDKQYTYLYGSQDEPVYFVDPYAKVNANEDRARLMEYVMYRDLDARMMLEHPALEAKLRILCDAVRQAFDTQNWETVHWERFF